MAEIHYIQAYSKNKSKKKKQSTDQFINNFIKLTIKGT